MVGAAVGRSPVRLASSELGDHTAQKLATRFALFGELEASLFKRVDVNDYSRCPHFRRLYGLRDPYDLANHVELAAARHIRYASV